MTVPFIDLKEQAAMLEPEMKAGFPEFWNSCAYSGGKYVEELEKKLAEKIGVAHAVAVNTGTEALHLALQGIKPGDEVITVPNTFVATVEAICYMQGTPVFCDVNPDTLLMDADSLRARITPKTRAIIPVHLYGNMCDMDTLLAVAKEAKLFVVEDACQAINGTYKGKQAGSMSHVGCFSFYPTKNLGAAGEGGMLVTNDLAIAEVAKDLRSHGGPANVHKKIGYNYRMHGFQGWVLGAKLKYLNGWTDARRARAAQYAEELKGVDGIKLQTETPGAKHVYHVMAVEVENREALKEHLKVKGIGFHRHYPLLVYQHGPYKEFTPKEGCPVAEASNKKGLSLPLWPEMKESQVSEVCDAIKSFYQK